MGVVHRARDRELDREVAVKVLQHQYPSGSATARRFVDEARITAQLQHPGIPAVYQVGTCADGQPYLAMKLIKGDTLDNLLKADAPLDRLAVFEAICHAVGYAHAHEVIHRDLKPANVMVGAFGEVQVMDWGLAKQLATPGRPGGGRAADPCATTAPTEIRTGRESDTPFTQYGSVLGTPAFMAPEQAVGELDKVGARSDVFGLGAILCVLLTDQPPYTGKDADSVRVAALRGRTEEAFARLDGCGANPEVIALCKRCLAFEPADRPADGREVGRAVVDLRRAADERAHQAERDRLAAEVQVGEQRKRRRVIQWAASAVAAVLLVGVVGTGWGLIRAEERRREAESALDAKEEARAAEEEAKKDALNAQAAVEERRKEAVHARKVATEQRGLALNTVRDVLLRVDNLMKNDAKLAPLRVSIIRQMLHSMDQIRDHAKKNPLEDRTEAIAYSNMGDVYFRTNRIEDAAVWHRKAHAILEKLVRESPDDPGYLATLASYSTTLAETEFRLGNGNRSHELLVRALELNRKRLRLVQVPKPTAQDQMTIASAEHDIANALQLLAYNDLRLGDPVSAIENYPAADRAFAALPPPMPNFLMVRRTRNEIKVRLADAHSKLGRLEDAEKLFREAIADRELLLKLTPPTGPNGALLKTDVGQSRMYLGDFLLFCRKDRARAGVEYAACLDLFSAQLKAHPDNLDLRQRLGATYYRLGLTATDPKKAKEIFAECLKIRQDLARIDPSDMQSGVEVALALARAGQDFEAERTARRLLAQAGSDRQVLCQVACTFAILAGDTADPEHATRSRELAFQTLRDLVKAGWKDRGGLESDPDFDAIRNDPRWQLILRALRSPRELDALKVMPPTRPSRVREEVLCSAIRSAVPAFWKTNTSSPQSTSFSLGLDPGDDARASCAPLVGEMTVEARKKQLARFNPYDRGGSDKNETRTGTILVGDTEAEYLDVRYTTVAKEARARVDLARVNSRRLYVYYRTRDGKLYSIMLEASPGTYEEHRKDFEKWLRSFKPVSAGGGRG
jgi:tetratricopeptide (TPR) repeat protein